VQNRTREIGLRKALGASPRRTVALVCRSVAIPSLAGALPGTFAGWLLARALSSHLFGVDPLDPLTLAVTAAGLVGAGIVAAASPIRRALRIDPATALRAL
jgi:ABC-type antimicrobial peptide transport system permease subunit